MTSRYSSGGGGNRFQVRVGTHADGRASKLNRQITTQLAFTENDDKSIKIIRKAWDTFRQPNFDPAQSRNGVAIGLNNARVDKYYQSILAWATHSTDGDDPGGHPDFPHLWPGQNPSPGSGRTRDDYAV
jgi:hypothetical protein